MDNVLSTAGCRELDRFTIDKGHSTAVRLMRNAGRAVAIEAAKMLAGDVSRQMTIVCGKGHNGGDGLAAAQFLREWGYNCQLALTCAVDDLDAVTAQFHDDPSAGDMETATPDQVTIDSDGLIIDALLGIGAKGPLHEPMESWVGAINAHGGPVLSVDLPTGLNGDSGDVASVAVRADVTVTMGYDKLGLLINDGPDLAGQVVVTDIGFADSYFNNRTRSFYRYRESDFAAQFAPPGRQTYKHRQGKTLVISGSLGMTGAAMLSGSATLRSGSGLTIAACPLSLQHLYAASMPEIITLGLDDHGQGMFLPEHISLIQESLEWCSALVMGPGLSRAPQCLKFVRNLLPNIDVPMILDADALAAFNGQAGLLNAGAHPLVLTPHVGEFALLFDHDRAAVQADPISALTEVGSYFNHTVVLKGAPSMVLLSNGDIVINSSGNPGMATAGSGDVLSGVIGTFLSQGYSADEAALMGVWLHGRAGDLAAEQMGTPGMTATDLLQHVPLALAEFGKV
ncbi:MAG: NAD(P)H-hydrate dehydratase [Candidatus Marinimicrobia bacterium]|nr:NAD(P)H-hydrate dehydratase [Candidatus Neomarinimicrobiota bacterium]